MLSIRDAIAKTRAEKLLEKVHENYSNRMWYSETS